MWPLNIYIYINYWWACMLCDSASLVSGIMCIHTSILTRACMCVRACVCALWNFIAVYVRFFIWLYVFPSAINNLQHILSLIIFTDSPQSYVQQTWNIVNTAIDVNLLFDLMQEPECRACCRRYDIEISERCSLVYSTYAHKFYNSVSSIISYATMKLGKLNRYSDGLQAEQPRNRYSIPDRGFCLIDSVQTVTGSYPAFYRMGTRDFFPGVKRPWREANRSTSSSAEVKNGRSIPPLPHTFSWPGA
jgi:hypothetical protein